MRDLHGHRDYRPPLSQGGTALWHCEKCGKLVNLKNAVCEDCYIPEFHLGEHFEVFDSVTKHDPNDPDGWTIVRLIRVFSDLSETMIKLALWDMDYFEAERCHHSHDCCGCIFGGTMDIKHITQNIWRIECRYARNT